MMTHNRREHDGEKPDYEVGAIVKWLILMAIGILIGGSIGILIRIIFMG